MAKRTTRIFNATPKYVKAHGRPHHYLGFTKGKGFGHSLYWPRGKKKRGKR